MTVVLILNKKMHALKDTALQLLEHPAVSGKLLEARRTECTRFFSELRLSVDKACIAAVDTELTVPSLVRFLYAVESCNRDDFDDSALAQLFRAPAGQFDSGLEMDPVVTALNMLIIELIGLLRIVPPKDFIAICCRRKRDISTGDLSLEERVARLEKLVSDMSDILARS